MNREVFPSSLVHQIVEESPRWGNMNNPRPAPQNTSPPSSSSYLALPHNPHPSTLLSMSPWHDTQELPGSWSQLLIGGLGQEEDRCNSFNPFQPKRMENWDDQVLYSSGTGHKIDVKQEFFEGGYVYGHKNEEIQASWPTWTRTLQTSSPPSCVTTCLNNSMLDFSSSKAERRNHQNNHSSGYNSTSTGSAVKKARIQTTSAHSTFKGRKEKLGDRITALHQLVSPFGKTDTASVLLETFGYIRFLQSQIEALSTPYFGSGSGSTRQSVQGEMISIFPEDPGQLLNDAKMNRRGPSDKVGDHEPKQDLRSRGLCLVPVSFMLHGGGSDNGTDYWAPSFDGGFR